MSEPQPGAAQRRPTGGHMGGPMGGGMLVPGQKARDFKGTMRELLHYLSPYPAAVATVFVFAIGSTVFSIVGPKILGKVTTKLFESIIAWAMGLGLLTDFVYIRNRIMMLLGLYILSFVFAYVQGWIMSGISMKITYQLRKNIAEKINRMPLRYFDANTHGEVLSRITNDVDAVGQTLNQSLTQLVTSITMLLGVLAMMLSISWLMTLASLCVIPLSGVLLGLVIKRSQGYFKEQQKYLGHVNGHVEEMYSGHIVVKAFNGEARSVEEFDKFNDALFGSAWKSQFLSSLMQPIMGLIGNLSYVVVCILGGWLAVTGSLNIGDIQAFIQYVRSFTQPIVQLATISSTLQSTVAAAERVFEFLNEDEETPEAACPIHLDRVAGHVEFAHVHFGYNPDRTIINDFSARIKPGQKVAIVGPTGAGKSTMIKLLMRFYDVNDGSIMVDGNDIRALTRADLRRIFGMVLQDTWLYNGSIMENIRYGRLDATDEEVMAAARAAHVDGFVRTLPDGYHMVLNEDASNVSQGQKQLLTIARAILADPKILILDEATSSVDTRTEVLIQRAMENLMQGRTSFVIAHRLSTVRDSDLILVMKDGDIVEQGNHVELLARNGFYANLYNSQFDAAD